ncbi:efflux RND transporter permease subunit [Anoxynatronum buryatiense]|uniref:Hydrophobic/amphiphilic exporter-1, HAE1 family n=1 Tax=Anoxynatronum buryatiense TaxID=489973 RepID=A0AA45WWA0_9CLOT|nr:efflux RND transporter permease subunit [Anoxynatronum buryatiense]SMP57271.1 hydrophobic/amphiphilic exporter-1, HAE1 family [Anoxynatronum buryatiense]
MDVTKISIKRPVTVLVAMMIVFILGFVSISKMQMALTPNVDFPIALIMTEYSGAGPEEVENLVTEVIEGAVSNVEHLDSVSSTSSEGLSIVMAQFNYGIDLDKAVNDIRSKIDMVEQMLPGDASSPTIMKLDMNAAPIATIVVSSENMNSDALKAFAEDTLQPRIERQQGVASVDVTGGVEKEIRIEINPERLQGLGLTLAGIGQTIQAENTNQPGGTIEFGEQSLSISSRLKMESIEDIKATPIRLPGGAVLRLDELAEITETDKKIESISRYNGEESVSLSVTKTSDGNTVDTVKAVRKEIGSVSETYPDVKIALVDESGSVIENSINNVISNIVIGISLSILVLFIFLKNVGLTGIIAISMPLSIIGTFVLLYFSGTTLNLISLGGISIGVGMLVDNSVVVLESIHRYRSTEGYDRLSGTYKGTKAVGLAITASTLTTVVIFLPFIFSSGLVQELLTDLALSVVFSLLMSVVVAVTVVPMLSGNYVNNIHQNTAPKPFGFINVILNGFDRFIKGLDHLYQKCLRWALRHKKKTLATIVGIFVASLFTLPYLGMELMPTADEGTFQVTVEADAGSNLESVNQISLQVEALLEKLPEMETMTVSMSGGSGGMARLMGGGSGQSNITCTLVDKTQRTKSVDQILEEIRNEVTAVAGAKVTVSATSEMGALSGGGSQIDIYGDDLEMLREISDELISRIAHVEGVRQLESSLEELDRQVVLKMDREKIRHYDLTGSQVASQVRNMVSGYTASTLKVNGTELDMRIVYPEEAVTTLMDLNDLTISTLSGAYIPLSSVADIILDDVPDSINRTDQTRYSTVSYSIFGRSTGVVGNEVQRIIDQMNLPEGYTASFGGTNQMMDETFSSLFTVIILAVVLVYLVMAAQFESLINPFIIMFTIPLAYTGAFLLLFITGEPLSMMALIGCLVLVGIVVNNGIILVDYINTLRDEDGLETEEATLKACPTRLRPILMTAMTTIFAQFPIIFSSGANSEMLKSMGLVIAGGLFTSTFLTLLLVPVLYIYFDRFSSKLRKLLRLKPKMRRAEIEQALR